MTLARGHPSNNVSAVPHWVSSGSVTTSLSYPTEMQSSNSKHPPDQQSRNGQFPTATTTPSRASLYQSMGNNSSHTQHSVPSHFGTRGHTARSHATPSRHIFNRSHQTSAFLQLVVRTGKSPLICSLFRIAVSILSRWIVVPMNNFLAPIILP